MPGLPFSGPQLEHLQNSHYIFLEGNKQQEIPNLRRVESCFLQSQSTILLLLSLIYCLPVMKIALTFSSFLLSVS